MRHIIAAICVLSSVACAAAATLTLSWTDNSTNETGFRVERKIDGGAWTVLAAVPANATTATDTGPFVAGQTLTYRVCAFNMFGDSGWSNEVSILTGVPNAPGAIKVTVQVQVGVLRSDYPMIAATLAEGPKP